jgi:hypothetical protein
MQGVSAILFKLELGSNELEGVNFNFLGWGGA